MLEMIKLFDEVIIKLNKNVRTLKIYPKVFEESEFRELHKFFDKALFTALNQLDLIIGLKYLKVSQALGNQLEANYFSRNVILITHEILNDLNKMVGKEVRDEIKNKLEENFLKEIDVSTKALSGLRKKHLKKLKEWRNTVSAHKEGHTIKQAEIIVGIDSQEIYEIGNEIYKAQEKFIISYMKILENI